MRPKGLLFDYGGTLVEEVSVDLRAGNEWLFARASFRPSHVTLDDVFDRASRVIREVVARRDHSQLETAWPQLNRLIYDFLGIRFDDPVADLELGFWIEDPERGSQNVRSDVSVAILREFKARGIEIPYPQREVRLLGAGLDRNSHRN